MLFRCPLCEKFDDPTMVAVGRLSVWPLRTLGSSGTARKLAPRMEVALFRVSHSDVDQPLTNEVSKTVQTVHLRVVEAVYIFTKFRFEFFTKV